MQNISPKMQNQINMLQQMQQQMQAILSQKNQYELAAQEARRAVEELNDAEDSAVVYMSVGTVVMQKPRADVIGKVTEKIEMLEIRIRSIEKQEKMLQEKFEKLQQQVRQEMEGRTTPEAA
ncbi:MAG: prefoldin subunit beta [Methanospirillum sp.]|nr:prefoldin subunit beta [Methanospirillum sp.]